MKLFHSLLWLAALAWAASAQVTYERLLDADKEPGNWLTYSRTYDSRHYSPLDQIQRENVADLELKWVFQARSLDKFQTKPLVVDGVMYLTQPPNDVVALDARTGRRFWIYEHTVPERVNVCCGRVNRGLAILGDTLYMGTLDGRLLALDAKTDSVLWDVEVVNYRHGYALTMAPLVVKDKVLIGPAGANTEFADLSTLTMRARANEPGAFTPFPVRASPATTPGKETPGSGAEAPSG